MAIKYANGRPPFGASIVLTANMCGYEKGTKGQVASERAFKAWLANPYDWDKAEMTLVVLSDLGCARAVYRESVELG